MASATTVTLDFSDPTNSTATVKLITTNADGAVKNVNVGGRDAVQTGGGTGDGSTSLTVSPSWLFCALVTVGVAWMMRESSRAFASSAALALFLRIRFAVELVPSAAAVL